MEGFKHGDWRCAGCGDHQFARNTSCRKCGTSKPEEAKASKFSSEPTEFKEGDWACVSCGDHQFARNNACRKCGTPRPSSNITVTLASDLPQDDDIPITGFAPEREKSVFRSSPYEDRTLRLLQASRGGDSGDWSCPDCGDVQFAKNSACRLCGAAKPSAQGRVIISSVDNEAFRAELRGVLTGQVAREVIVASNSQIAKPGDWLCPNPDCRDLQFERNQVCRRCSTPKPESAAVPVIPKPRKAREPTLQESPVEFKHGDWSCPSCGDHQFQKNTHCRKCGTGKPPKPATSTMVPKPGDWVCPNPVCRDVQFERNIACRKCGTPKPVLAALGKYGLRQGTVNLPTIPTIIEMKPSVTLGSLG